MKLRINGRIYILVALFAAGCGILAFALNTLREQDTLLSRKQSLVQLVDTAIGVLEAHKKLADLGALPDAEARKRALGVIDGMRYNGTDYFFVRSIDGIMLVSPGSPNTVGTKRDDVAKDANGKLFQKEMTWVLQSPAAQGFVDYTFTKPGSTEQQDKVSFIKAYKPWNMAVGTGVYIGDLSAHRAASALQAAGITAALLAIMSIVTLLIANSIVVPLKRINTAMKDIGEGRQANLAGDVGRADELGEMACSVVRLQEGVMARMQAEAEARAQRQRAQEEHAAREREKQEEAQRMQQTIDALGGGLTRLAQGDLMCRLEAPFPAETEMLRVDFNTAVDKLHEAVKAIAASTHNISSGAYEITTASDDLSRRTEQQAATLEETAAALDQITATVKKAAEGSSHAREVVGTAKIDAETGGSVVGRAVGAMSGIQKSSEQIGQILGVIDEIAFQTNLLALNAGVEAARAGEAGRGFAVVAAEVRALAQRSADAAKEIKEIIRLSATQVAEGVNLVGETGKSLERIMAQVNDINAVMAQLAVGAQDQATNLTQVNTALNDMDGVTQQNAAMVEETTAASHTLRKESETLTRLIGQFRIGSEAAQARHAAGPAPARAPAPKRPATAAAKPAAGRPRIVHSNPRPAARKSAVDNAQVSDWEEF
jgi:methyl-accepting chemotaxis protein